MASMFSFGEDNGAGPTRTFGRTGVYWKSSDSSTDSDYASNPITAGNLSFRKYQFAVFTGTFNQISNAKFGHTTGILGTGLNLWYSGATAYTTPSAAAITGGTSINMTLSSGLAANAQTVLLGGLISQATSGTLAVTGYSHYLITQLATTTGASAGDTSLVTFTFSYDES